MSDGYRPYVHPESKREEWAAQASMEQLSEAVQWASEARKEAVDEWGFFFGHLLAKTAADSKAVMEDDVDPWMGYCCDDDPVEVNDDL